MSPYFVFNSRIATHVTFWLVYYLTFGFLWASEGNYLASFSLEFILLPIRISAVYLTIYLLIPKYLTRGNWLRFGGSYVVMLTVAGILQRVFTHYFYEGLFTEESFEIFSVPAIVRGMVLINSTVLFVSAIKITQLWFEEKRKVRELESSLAKTSEIIEVKAEKRMFRIPAEQVLYVEGLGNYVTFHLKDQKIISYSSLKEIGEALPGHFVRIHKSYIVNKDHISSYNNEDVEIEGRFLPIGRSYKGQVMI